VEAALDDLLVAAIAGLLLGLLGSTFVYAF
jgi:hypothetical protein